MSDTETFPRQKARTRGFQLGRPRTFSARGDRLFFLRSASGSDAFGCLWQVDLSRLGEPELEPTCLVDADRVMSARGSGPDEGLAPAELARRERMREVSSGITAYDIDADGQHVAFSVDGVLYAADVTDPHSPTLRRLPAPGPVVDPRIDPTGTRIAFVVDGEVWCGGFDASAPQRLRAREYEHQSWGLADFIAAEELERHRGHWWMPDGQRLLVEEVDERDVETWWISDPSDPAAPPRPHPYPAAGRANARVALWLVDLDGAALPVPWDHAAYEYLATVRTDGAAALVELLSRDQRSARIARLDVNADGPELVTVQTRSDPAWIDIVPGTPLLGPDGRSVIVVDVDRATDTHRLRHDEGWLSPPGLQISEVLGAGDDGIVTLASPNPLEQHCYVIHEGQARRLDVRDGTDAADHATWVAGTSDGATVVLARSSLDSCTARFEVRSLTCDARLEIANLSEVPHVRVRPTVNRVGSRGLATAVLVPDGHRGEPLPVICSPYGGPHAQRVISAAAAYTTEQWIADQGFAVVVIDGRGTPGRGPEWERAILDDWSAAVVQDQVDALLEVAGMRSDLDLSRVGIRGWSFGGYLAALAVLDRPDVFHAAVAGAPVTEWRLYDTAYTERYLGDPASASRAYDAASLLPRAPALTRPLLLIHGTADDNVHVANTLQLSNALLAAGRPHSVVPLSRVTHMTPQEHVAENLLRLEIDFFTRHLGRNGTLGD